MSVKYTVRHNDQVIGSRKSAGHLIPTYTHAVVRVLEGHNGLALSYWVLSYCSRLDLAHKEAARRTGGNGTIVVLPVEAQVTTRKQPSQVEG